MTVRGYADPEELVMKAWLGLAGRGYTMSEGQTVIWRMYLERNPGDQPACELEDADTGKTWKQTGQELGERGVRVTLEKAPESRLVFYRRVGEA